MRQKMRKFIGTGYALVVYIPFLSTYERGLEYV